MVTNSGFGPPSRLVVTAPGVLRGRVFVLDGQRMVVGRERAAEVFLDDPHVSRAHAALDRVGTSIMIHDLGSSGGTTVNGRPIRDRQALRDGDVLGFAGVEARYESAVSDTDETVIGPTAVRGRPQASRHPAPSPDVRSSPDVRFDVDRQQHGHFNNVAGDQYNQYVQQVRQERASFLEEVAGARTRARRIIVFGFLLALLGGGVFFWVVINYAASFSDLFTSVGEGTNPNFPSEFPSPFGPEVGGIPVGLIGFAVAALGSVLMLVGIVMHISAAARRRRRESEFAAALHLPPPYRQ